tara:strand:+ start:3133 stop:3588 length:456 start_codon:yes stop_codon:yes gene_type:complete
MCDLEKLFIDNLGEPVVYKGQAVCGDFRIPVRTGQVFRVTFVESSSKFGQGISIDTNGQFVLHNARPDADQGCSKIILWEKTAPKITEWVAEKGDWIEVWNAWDTGDGVIDSGHRNAGMLHSEEDGVHVFRCSDGPGDVDFGNLVFTVEVL